MWCVRSTKLWQLSWTKLPPRKNRPAKFVLSSNQRALPDCSKHAYLKSACKRAGSATCMPHSLVHHGSQKAKHGHLQFLDPNVGTYFRHLWSHRRWNPLIFSERELSRAHVHVGLNVRAPYLGYWNFRQCFYAIWYLGHLWPFDKIFTEIRGTPPTGD